MDESLPIEHPDRDHRRCSAKMDVAANASNNVSGSWNFNHSRKENETFDVATYGTSANGIEGDPARINVVNLNWFTTLSQRMLNEAHFTYSRESRPRTAVDSPLKADTGIGLRPDVPLRQSVLPAAERRRADLADADQGQRLAGPRQAHVQVRRRVDAHAERPGVPRVLHRPISVRQRDRLPALRLAGGAGGFGPNTVGCSNGVYVTAPAACPAGSTPTGGPLLLYLQGAGRAARQPTRRAPRRSPTTSSRSSSRISGSVPAEPHRQLRPALGRADHARNGRPADDGVRGVPERSRVPVRRHHPEPVEHVPAALRRRVGRAGATASRSSAAAPASTSRGRTCSRRSDRSRPTACSSRRSSCSTAI